MSTTLIALGCGDRHVHNMRSEGLANLLISPFGEKIQNVILSGGANNGNTISEAEKMYQILQKRNIPEIRSDINIFLEEKSCDTMKNLRNSIWLALDNGIIIPNSVNKQRIRIYVLTSIFHILRSQQGGEYLLETEFPGVENIDIEMIGAENFVSEKYKNRILSHPQWIAKEEKFKEGEARGLLTPVANREYNKPENLRIYTGK